MGSNEHDFELPEMDVPPGSPLEAPRVVENGLVWRHKVTIYWVDPLNPTLPLRDERSGLGKKDAYDCIMVDELHPHFLILVTASTADHMLQRAIRWDRIAGYETESWKVEPKVS